MPLQWDVSATALQWLDSASTAIWYDFCLEWGDHCEHCNNLGYSHTPKAITVTLSGISDDCCDNNGINLVGVGTALNNVSFVLWQWAENCTWGYNAEDSEDCRFYGDYGTSYQYANTNCTGSLLDTKPLETLRWYVQLWDVGGAYTVWMVACNIYNGTTSRACTEFNLAGDAVIFAYLEDATPGAYCTNVQLTTTGLMTPALYLCGDPPDITIEAGYTC